MEFLVYFACMLTGRVGCLCSMRQVGWSAKNGMEYLGSRTALAGQFLLPVCKCSMWGFDSTPVPGQQPG